jgi:hypothetical protein
MEIEKQNIVIDSSLPKSNGLDLFCLKHSIKEKQLAKSTKQIVKK